MKELIFGLLGLGLILSGVGMVLLNVRVTELEKNIELCSIQYLSAEESLENYEN